jgi:hypothetical protein
MATPAHWQGLGLVVQPCSLSPWQLNPRLPIKLAQPFVEHIVSASQPHDPVFKGSLPLVLGSRDLRTTGTRFSALVEPKPILYSFAQSCVHLSVMRHVPIDLASVALAAT